MSMLALLVTRFLTIFGFGSLSAHLTGDEISLREQAVLCWGGLRGSVSIALALSIPVGVAERQDIIDTVFGVVLLSLLGQGLSMQWLMEKVNLIGDRPLRQAYSELLARRIALTRVFHHLEAIEPTLTLDPEQYRYEKELIIGEMKSIEDKIAKAKTEYPQLRSLEVEHLRETLFDIEASTYAELIREGQLNTNLSPILQGLMAKAELEKP
jgi:CPA1 family monovalent cation:H+ antiporter